MVNGSTKNRKIKKEFVLITCICLWIVSIFISISNGAVNISIKEIIDTILFNHETSNYQIIQNVRLPRTIVASCVGTCFALSGCILQGIMRNPLAGPNIIGVSSGAGLASLIILIIFPNYYYLAPASAFVGALLATLFIYSLAWRNGSSPTKMILAGVAVSSFLSAGTNTIMTFYPNKISSTISFMVGGLGSANWNHVKMIMPYTILGIILIFFIVDKLNILMLGDEVSIGLGIKIEKTRFMFIIISSLLAGAAVSVVGLLGFVGLIVPHITRLFVGSDYRYLMPTTIFTGASIVLICDTISRVMFAPIEIPVGIIMSALGAPFFLYLLRKKREY